MVIAGLMSGTSLDGVDCAVVRFNGPPESAQFTLLGFRSVPYESVFRTRLDEACSTQVSISELLLLDRELGQVFADAVASVCQRCGIAPNELDAIGSHGQTVWHEPARQVSLQIGSPSVLSEAAGTAVVADFRAADLAAGGQGAPLVPFMDRSLLRHDTEDRVALNIGGIANVTWLPSRASNRNVIAFDTGPGNMMIDEAARILFDKEFDEGGAIAASGSVDQELLGQLLEEEYYSQAPPKSTGRELFGRDRATRICRSAAENGTGPADILATLTMLTARTIVDGVEAFAAPCESVSEIIVSGGGARNSALMSMVDDLSGPAVVSTSDSHGLPSDAKEAICFALLAYATIRGEPSNVPSATGASGPRVLGSVRSPLGNATSSTSDR